MTRARLYALYRILRHLFLTSLGKAEKHRDAPIVWTLRRRAQRAGERLFHIPRPAHPAVRHPIFTVCSIRSGSTLAARCLGQHPGITCVGFELSRQWMLLAEIQLAGAGDAKTTHCPPLDEQDAFMSRRESVRQGFAELLARTGNGNPGRFLNKNPHLWNKLPFLKAIFPDASLVVCGRDLRSTVASIKQLWIRSYRVKRLRHFIPENPAYCFSVSPCANLDRADPARIFPGGRASVLAEFWLNIYETIERHAPLFPTVVSLRHRDLVENPRAALHRVYTALDLDPLDTPLPEPLDPTRNQRWRRTLSDEEKEDLESFIQRRRARIQALTLADTTL